ncbi:ABC transporter substrate-binding protein [Calidifontibacter indicus]|uniref:ABC transporter substrate-binding protein n=1 Tax=Calidifontibacter indicus TaxID=419650 RepID=UPI003D7245FC
MALVHSPARIALGVAVALGFGLSACGSDSLEEGGKSATESVKSVAKDNSLADKVPAALKSKGTLSIGTDATYAPNEFVGDDGKTITGMDIDLLTAALQKLGLKATFTNGQFGTLILGVDNGKFDASVSSFTINDERKKAVNMVSYFNAGTQWAVKKGNPKKVKADDACGLTVGVQKDTVQVDDLAARSKKCTQSGKKAITSIIEQDQSKVTANLISGKVDAMLADSPVALYAVQKNTDSIEALGSIYDAAPYGVVVKKSDTAFAQLLAQAFKSIKDDGTYTSVLKKWGNETGAINSFEVNPSVK